MVDNTARLPEVSYEHKYGELRGIVPEGLDALDMGLLHRMGELSPLFSTFVVSSRGLMLIHRSTYLSSHTSIED